MDNLIIVVRSLIVRYVLKPEKYKKEALKSADFIV